MEHRLAVEAVLAETRAGMSVHARLRSALAQMRIRSASRRG
jgi:hypothetical protein